LTSVFCVLLLRRPPSATLFPYTTLFRSLVFVGLNGLFWDLLWSIFLSIPERSPMLIVPLGWTSLALGVQAALLQLVVPPERRLRDRKSTRLNSSHVKISYAVFCLKKKNN